MSQLGQKLRELRKERKLTLAQVSDQVGIDIAILSKIERGERKISKAIVQKLAACYEVNAEPLIVSALNEQLLQQYGQDELGQQAIMAAEQSLPYKPHKMTQTNVTSKDSAEQILLAIASLERGLAKVEIEEFLKDDIKHCGVLFNLLAINEYAKMIGRQEVERHDIPFSFLNSFEEFLTYYFNPNLEKGFEAARTIISMKAKFLELKLSL
jgi:transcriptional regulator with XRE-family HTH domain